MNMSTPYVIETHDLGKTYKKIQALKALDLKVQQNSTFGFLGPNGAIPNIVVTLDRHQRLQGIDAQLQAA